jgi:hypothetical protein
MIDWNQVTGFDWDSGNARKSSDKHGVSQAEAEQVFFTEPLLVLEDRRHSDRERRWHALGQTFQQRLLHVTFTLRGEGSLIRVISARPMHRKEKSTYVKAQKGSTGVQDGD